MQRAGRLTGPLSILFESAGTGVALAHPEWRWLGYLIIAVGAVPLAFTLAQMLPSSRIARGFRLGQRMVSVQVMIMAACLVGFIGAGVSLYVERTSAAVRVWYEVDVAAQRFADLGILDRLADDRTQQAMNDQRTRETVARINELSPGGPAGAMSAPESEELRAMRERLVEIRESTVSISNRRPLFAQQIRADLKNKLRQGLLVARGFPESDPTEMRDIPTIQWRFLSLDGPDATGGGLRYVAIEIGRPNSSRLRENPQ